MFTQISVDEAKTIIDKKDALLFDIRDMASFQTNHIDGAKHLTSDQIRTLDQTYSKETPVIVYCYLGKSSQTAAQIIAGLGFSHVYSIEGGIAAWKEKYEVVSD